ncbi:MAG: ABC transporter substrate-binding protein [Alphaproteobacteria bacterium]|nr:ABC transporter substrate-binding protein [Alphaproteobacteria bacterium]
MLIDAVGNKHAVAPAPARIVSLVPSLTELLFALDLQDQLVGRTAFCIEPAGRVEAVPVVGGTKTSELDKLMALNPSHVLVNVDETPKALAEQISAAGPRVVVTHPNTPADNVALYQLIGGLFQRRELAATLVAALQQELRQAMVWPERKVLYLIWKRPWMTVSQDTYIASMLSLFGMQTLCHDPARRYPEVAIDAALLAEADLVLFSTEPFPFAAKHRDAFAREFKIAASPQLHAIDGKMVSWYGSRAIEGLRYLRAFAAQLDVQ